MNKITVKYFALLREKTKCSQEELSFDGKTYRELYQWLSTKYQFGLSDSMVQVAVNDCFTSLDQQVENEARVVFIPPVAGG